MEKKPNLISLPRVISLLIILVVSEPCFATPLPEKLKNEFVRTGIQSCIIEQVKEPLTAKHMTKEQVTEYCECTMTMASHIITLEQFEQVAETKNADQLSNIMLRVGAYCTQKLMEKWGY